jgi:hypothetical protein
MKLFAHWLVPELDNVGLLNGVILQQDGAPAHHMPLSRALPWTTNFHCELNDTDLSSGLTWPRVTNGCGLLWKSSLACSHALCCWIKRPDSPHLQHRQRCSNECNCVLLMTVNKPTSVFQCVLRERISRGRRQNNKNYSRVLHVKWVPCHHGMARPPVADGGDSLQIWRVAANILNKQTRGWSSNLGAGRRANNLPP